jgi:hypothetical protein
MMKKSPRPKANPKRGMATSPRPKANPFIPKMIEERSTREMAKGGKTKKMANGGMCRGMGAAKKGGNYSKAG